MKNFLILCFLLAPTFITRAQLLQEIQTSTLPALAQLDIDPAISDSSQSDKPVNAISLYVNALATLPGFPVVTLSIRNKR